MACEAKSRRGKHMPSRVPVQPWGMGIAYDFVVIDVPKAVGDYEEKARGGEITHVMMALPAPACDLHENGEAKLGAKKPIAEVDRETDGYDARD